MMTSSNGSIFRVSGPSPVTGEFPSQRSVTRSFNVFFDLCLIWANNRGVGDLRHHRAHYDVTVMIMKYHCFMILWPPPGWPIPPASCFTMKMLFSVYHFILPIWNEVFSADSSYEIGSLNDGFKLWNSECIFIWYVRIMEIMTSFFEHILLLMISLGCYKNTLIT